MDPFESETHSFVVKIWLEEAEDAQGSPTWRGHITHVASNQRKYVEDLGGITKFISIYLEKMGVEVGERWHGIKGWLRGGSA
jgi:hypothetical protein